MANGFWGVRGESLAVVEFVVHFLIEVEAEEGTAVDGGTSEASHWDPIDGGIEGVVQEVADIQEAEEPGVGWSASSVKDDVDSLLQLLDASFHGVLELFVGLTEPSPNQH